LNQITGQAAVDRWEPGDASALCQEPTKFEFDFEESTSVVFRGKSLIFIKEEDGIYFAVPEDPEDGLLQDGDALVFYTREVIFYFFVCSKEGVPTLFVHFNPAGPDVEEG
jgi:hypothetical protein